MTSPPGLGGSGRAGGSNTIDVSGSLGCPVSRRLYLLPTSPRASAVVPRHAWPPPPLLPLLPRLPSNCGCPLLPFGRAARGRSGRQGPYYLAAVERPAMSVTLSLGGWRSATHTSVVLLLGGGLYVPSGAGRGGLPPYWWCPTLSERSTTRDRPCPHREARPPSALSFVPAGWVICS